MAVNWGLATGGVDPGQMFMQGMDKGRAIAKERRVQNAFAAYAQNPDDPQAANDLLINAPDLALKFREDRRKQAEAQRGADFRAAAGRILGPGSAAQSGPMNAFAEASQSGSANAMSRPVQSGPGMSQSILPQSVQPEPVQPEPVQPQEQKQVQPMRRGIDRQAFGELYSIDPEGAAELQKVVMQADEAGLKNAVQAGEVLARSAFHLSSIRTPDGQPDIEGRKRELDLMIPQLEALGLNVDAIRAHDLSDLALDRVRVMGTAMGTLVDDDRADRRLDWEIADDKTDNARADREATSRDVDRRERRGLVSRGQSMASADRRRGQDVASKDRRQGQAIASADRQRGQNMRGGGQTATDPKTGRKVQWNGKQWVPVN